jgi:hypothetical protein
MFVNVENYRTFVSGDLVLYQSVVKKLAPEQDPAVLAASTTPKTIVLTPPYKVTWTPPEQIYINMIFMMNEGGHQGLIGGADSTDEMCLCKAYGAARSQLGDFKSTHRKRERLPWWYWILHIAAGSFAISGVRQVLRWYGLWQKVW